MRIFKSLTIRLSALLLLLAPLSAMAQGTIRGSGTGGGGGGGGGTQYAEDAALGATPTGNLAIYRRDDALSALTPVEDDAISGRVNQYGAVWGILSAGDGTELARAEDSGHASGHYGLMALSVYRTATLDTALAGTDLDYHPNVVIAGADNLPTGILGTVSHSIIYCNDGSNLDQCGTSTTEVAHDAVDSGNSVKLGARAETAMSGITLVADADRTNLYAGIDGVLLVRLNSNLESQFQGYAAITDGSSTSVEAAGGASTYHYMTDFVCTNQSATNAYVDVRDGTAGAVLATFSCPANGGSHKNLQSPLAFSANTAIAADPDQAVNIDITVFGFTSAIDGTGS